LQKKIDNPLTNLRDLKLSDGASVPKEQQAKLSLG